MRGGASACLDQQRSGRRRLWLKLKACVHTSLLQARGRVDDMLAALHKKAGEEIPVQVLMATQKVRRVCRVWLLVGCWRRRREGARPALPACMLRRVWGLSACSSPLSLSRRTRTASRRPACGTFSCRT